MTTPAQTSPQVFPQVSVQLYTVKDALEADLEGTVARLAGLGLDAVEAFDFVRRPAELKAAFDAHASRRAPVTPSCSATRSPAPTAPPARCPASRRPWSGGDPRPRGRHRPLHPR